MSEGEQVNTGGESGDAGNANTGNPDKPSWFERKFPEAKAHDRLTLIFTGVIALSTVLYTIVAGWTLLEIHSGSTDTRNLAVAASQQASHTEEIAAAAGDQVDAANEISDAADSFSETADTAVEEFTKAAKESTENSQKTIRNSEDFFKDEQRAWIAVGPANLVQFESNQPIVIDLVIANSGKTPARKVRTVNQAEFPIQSMDGPSDSKIKELESREYDPKPSISPQGFITVHLGQVLPSGQIISAEQRSGTQTGAALVDLIKQHRLQAYFYGEVRYKDATDREHITQFCVFISDPDKKQLGACPNFNEIF